MDVNTDWVAGKVGSGALDFDGSNDYVTTTSTQASLDQTIAAWVYMRSYATGSNPDWMDMIFGKYTDITNGSLQLNVFGAAHGSIPRQPAFRIRRGGSFHTCEGGPNNEMPLNEWGASGRRPG